MAESILVAAPDSPVLLETPNVLAVTTTASSAQSLNVNHDASVFFTFICSVKVYIKIGDSGVAAPDETAAFGSGRCWEIPADTLTSVRLWPAQTHFRVKGVAAANFRWQVEEESGGGA